MKNSDQKYCQDCGNLIFLKAGICPHCGVTQPAIQPQYQPSTNDKNRISAALLALFLGGIGIHKFYLGQKGQGILYLVFFWTGLPMLISIFEGIGLLLMSDANFSKKYNQ